MFDLKKIAMIIDAFTLMLPTRDDGTPVIELSDYANEFDMPPPNEVIDTLEAKLQSPSGYLGLPLAVLARMARGEEVDKDEALAALCSLMLVANDTNTAGIDLAPLKDGEGHVAFSLNLDELLTNSNSVNSNSVKLASYLAPAIKFRDENPELMKHISEARVLALTNALLDTVLVPRDEAEKTNMLVGYTTLLAACSPYLDALYEEAAASSGEDALAKFDEMREKFKNSEDGVANAVRKFAKKIKDTR